MLVNPRGRKPRERADRSGEAARYGELSGDIDVLDDDAGYESHDERADRAQCTVMMGADSWWICANRAPIRK